jgi:hypothetical protein
LGSPGDNISEYRITFALFCIHQAAADVENHGALASKIDSLNGRVQLLALRWKAVRGSGNISTSDTKADGVMYDRMKDYIKIAERFVLRS